MKRNKAIWNYLDLIIQVIIVAFVIAGAYVLSEYLEKYIYRYVAFPFIAFASVFSLGLLIGRGIERTREHKPIGAISRKMAKERKQKNLFILSNDGAIYTTRKEVVDEIRSGEIVHIKQFVENEFVIDEFDDIYQIRVEDIVDQKMKNSDLGDKR